MIVTMEHVSILDRTEKLIQMITQSQDYIEYKRSFNDMQNDEKAQHLIRTFQKLKEQHEDIERFGSYYPGYSQIMTDIRKAKREMDLHDSVAKYKMAERQLQRFLDEVSEIIARSVSEHIIVPKDDQLFSDGNCSTGGCSTGGSCGCSAS